MNFAPLSGKSLDIPNDSSMTVTVTYNDSGGLNYDGT
jgi:hypothetical protein